MPKNTNNFLWLYYGVVTVVTVSLMQSSFPLIHKVGNVDILVQFLMRTNWKWMPAESVSIQIYICHCALN